MSALRLAPAVATAHGARGALVLDAAPLRDETHAMIGAVVASGTPRANGALAREQSPKRAVRVSRAARRAVTLTEPVALSAPESIRTVVGTRLARCSAGDVARGVLRRGCAGRDEECENKRSHAHMVAMEGSFRK